MSFDQSRQESIADDEGRTFKVGQGVHWGWNGDRDPGTVLFVSDSGQEVWVSSDTFEITDDKGGYVEGDRECTFTTDNAPLHECIRFKVYKRRDKKMRWAMSAHGNVLNPDRAYARNPSR